MSIQMIYKCFQLLLDFIILNLINIKKYDDSFSEEHVREYSYDEIKKYIELSGFNVKLCDGLFLSLKLSSKTKGNKFLLNILSKTGSIAPRLAHHLYFVLEKVRDVI